MITPYVHITTSLMSPGIHDVGTTFDSRSNQDDLQVQTSCGYAVPLLALTTEDGSSNGNGDEPKPKPHLKTRRTLQNSIRKKAEQGQLQAYHEQWNQKSLDGLPGLQSAQTHKSNTKLIWLGRLGDVIRGHRGIIEMIVLGLAVLWGVMC